MNGACFVRRTNDCRLTAFHRKWFFAMTTPPPLDPRSALFLDIDGTLLEIAPRPELVWVPEELPALLTRLAEQRGGALALISGRRIADFDRYLLPWRGAAAGVHGGERRDAVGRM